MKRKRRAARSLNDATTRIPRRTTAHHLASAGDPAVAQLLSQHKGRLLLLAAPAFESRITAQDSRSRARVPPLLLSFSRFNGLAARIIKHRYLSIIPPAQGSLRQGVLVFMAPSIFEAESVARLFVVSSLKMF